jgi:O-antigen/teichoic acid export membrane protein
MDSSETVSFARQILRNVGALTAARGVSAVCTFITTVYLARVLEPAGYGILNWGLAFLAYFNFAADLGMGVYAMREVARSEEQAWQLPGHVLLLRFTGALVTFGLFLSIVLLLDKDPLFKLTVAVLGLSLFAHVIELGWVYHGLQRLGVVAVRNVITSLVTLAGVFLLIRRPEQVVLAAAVIVAALALPNLWLLATYSREFRRPTFSVDWRLWGTMLLPALPIAASHLLTTINTNLDQVMLGLIRTETEVGWYAAAYRVLTAATIPWQIAHQAFLPSLSSAVGDRAAMRAHAAPFATSLYALGLPIAAGGFLLAPDIVTIFGAGYAEAGAPLAILMLSLAPMYMRIVYGGSLIAWDRQGAYTAVLTAGAALNVGLNIALIPPYGVEGAALATLLTEGVIAIGTAFLYYRSIHELHLGTLARTALATATGVILPLLAAQALEVPPLLAAGVAAGGYTVAVFTFRIVDPEALRRLRSLS